MEAMPKKPMTSGKLISREHEGKYIEHEILHSAADLVAVDFAIVEGECRNVARREVTEHSGDSG